MKNKFPFKNHKLPLADRVNDLVSRLTIEEKIGQMIHEALPIERFGIPAYNWWNEALHGVARAGHATVFPQAIGIAATFNRSLMHKIGTIISDEGRAKYHDALRHKNHGYYYGLTFWSPNVNIFRDPRWGRGQETFGEDPYLTGELGYEFVTALQGNDPTHLKTVATTKHFAVHSGPEKDRHKFDAIASPKDMEETYLPAFYRSTIEAKAESIMGAYNRTNGEACCASHTLLQKVLRDTWGFEGFVVSDCGAIDDIFMHHKSVPTAEAAAALAVKNGCELNCGNTYFALRTALEQGLITEAEIDIAVKRLFTARFKLGMFDPPATCAYSGITMDVVGCKKHRAQALQTARESIVLLKNTKNILPLDKKAIKTVAVIGPNANETMSLLGNYHGSPSRPVTPLQAIMDTLPPATKVLYSRGCDVNRSTSWQTLPDSIAIAKTSDVVIAVLGLSPWFEGEEGDAPETGGDRVSLELFKIQETLLEALIKTGTPVIVVLLNGSPVTLPSFAKAAAIVEAWYPGEAGGQAISDVLFGDYNPAGRLPLTFYESSEQLPPFEDYSMHERTYRYFTGKPLYWFGHGLSYTKFKYSGLKVSSKSISTSETLTVSVAVKNIGKRLGDEVVQVYVHAQNASCKVPRFDLREFKRVPIGVGKTTHCTFKLPASAFSVVHESGKRFIEPGRYDIYVSGGMPAAEDIPCLHTTIEITGAAKQLLSHVG